MQSILDFFEGLPERRWLLAGVIVAGSFVAAWLADQVILRVLLRWARRTAWKIDDDLLTILHHPVIRSVVLVGLGLAAGRLQLADGAAVATARTLWTLGILLWTVFAFRLCRILLLSASGQAERYRLIETRTFPLFDNLAKVLIVAVVSYVLILTWDVDATGWIASAGIIGIAVGFAAKDTLSNLFAGVLILADAPYRVGDFIVLDGGQRGQVVHIGLRSTRIRTRDDVEITVPNALVGSGMVTNESSTRTRCTPTRIGVSVGVAYGSDVDRVREVLLGVAGQNQDICVDPEPRVRFRAFGESGLDFQLLCWIPDPALKGSALDALNTAVYKRFGKEGIEIPYPKRDIYLHGMPAGPAAAGSPEGGTDPS